MKRLAWLTLLLALLLLSAAARFHRLDAQSLWYDEGITAAHTARSLNELIPLLQVNVHTPAYFLLLAGWTDLAGDSEFALRLPSALFSILSVALVYALGARLYGRLAGAAAAALVALNSFSIAYAQEARMYAMLTAIAGASMWLFICILDGRGKRIHNILAFGLINALGMYTQVVFALVMLGQALVGGLWLLAKLPSVPVESCRGEAVTRPQPSSVPLGSRAIWRVLIDYALANFLAVLLFVPWLPHSLQQVFSRPNRAQSVPPDEVLQLIAGHFAFGSNHALDMGAAWLAFGLLLLAGLLPTRAKAGWWRWLLPLAWLGISVLPYVSLELTTRYLRFLLPAQLAFALLLGRGAWLLWQRLLTRLAAVLALGAILLTMLAGLDNFYHHSDFQRDDMRGLVQAMEDDLRPNDGIIFSAPGLVDLLTYYYTGAAPIYPLPSTRDDDAIRSEVLDIIARRPRLHVILYGAREQDPRQVVEGTLNHRAVEVRDEWVGDLRYLEYVRRAQFGEVIEANLAFGEAITLKSYALESAALRPGDVLQAQFVWTTRQPINKRYKVFLQLLDEAGVLAAQRDSQPSGGAAPTTDWIPGETVIDRHALLIPPDLPAGEYALIAGLYDSADPLARMPVADGDYVDLGAVRIGEPRS